VAIALHEQLNPWVEMPYSLIGLNLFNKIVPMFLIKLINELLCDNPATSALANPEGHIFFVVPVLILLNALIHSINDFLVCLGICSRVASPHVWIWQQEFILFKLMVQIFVEHEARQISDSIPHFIPG
jgi:hypothetical protein